jgi:hypothetical protein
MEENPLAQSMPGKLPQKPAETDKPLGEESMKRRAPRPN